MAFNNVEELGTLAFDISYIGENYSNFTAVSPGPFTFEMGENGTLGATIAGGKKVKLCDVDGCAECAATATISGAEEGTKYYHVINDDNTLGSVVYADFYLYTDIFTTQNIIDINNMGGFDFSDTPAKSEIDEEAIGYLEAIYSAGKTALYISWGNGMTTEEKDEVWLSYCMDEVIRGNTDGLLDADNSAELIEQAEEWADYVMTSGIAHLKTLDKWNDDFDYWWDYYKMDDIKKGIYHGTAKDYTDVIAGYIENMLDEYDHVERQGCVAVNAELASILQILMDLHTFEGVENSWVKLCYYYQPLTAENNPYFD